MPHPHADGEGRRLRIDLAPVHLARLQLHDAKRAGDRTEVRRRFHQVRRLADGIAVAAEHVCAGDGVKREGGEVQAVAATRIGRRADVGVVARHPLFGRGVFLDDRRLIIKKMCGGIGLIARKVEQGVRAQFVFCRQRGVGQMHLLETGVATAPERAAPRRVHGVDAAVLVLQPVLESGAGAIAVVGEGAGFVVDLPAPDARVVAVVLRHGRDQSRHEGLVLRIGQRYFGANAVLVALTMLVYPIDLRVVFVHPGRRRCRGRTQNDAQSGLVGQVDGLIEPREIETPFLRLKVGPAEFGHVRKVEAELGHAIEVPLPLLAGPLLGVIENAKAHRLALVQQGRAL